MKWFVLTKNKVNQFGPKPLALEWACLQRAIYQAAGKRAAVVGRIGGRFVRVA